MRVGIIKIKPKNDLLPPSSSQEDHNEQQSLKPVSLLIQAYQIFKESENEFLNFRFFQLKFVSILLNSKHALIQPCTVCQVYSEQTFSF